MPPINGAISCTHSQHVFCFCVALHFFQCSRRDVEGRCLSLPLTCTHTRLLIEVKKEITSSAPPQEHSFKKVRGRRPVLSVSRKRVEPKTFCPRGLLFFHHFISLFVFIPTSTSELWQGRGERANVERSVASAGAVVMVLKKAPPRSYSTALF